MMKRKARHSPQKETILQIVLDAKSHLLAEDVHKKAQKRIKDISLGTVYRNLSKLIEEKQISNFQSLRNLTYFEPFQDPHHHFICQQCEKIENVGFPTVNYCKACIAPKAPFRVDDVTMTIYGTCENCVK